MLYRLGLSLGLLRKSSPNAVQLPGRRLMLVLAVVPTLVFYTVWLFIPMVGSVGMTFYDWNPFAREQPFVGLDNYREAFTQDPLFWQVLRTTLTYTFISIPVGACLALVLAAMINSLPRFTGFFRTVYFIPVVTSGVAVSIVWKWLYQGRFGLFNHILRFLFRDLIFIESIDVSVPWLTSKEQALYSIMLMTIWQGIGFTMVIFLAGLTSIPRVFYEAAQIDGAGRLQQFFDITVPLLRPTVNFVLITGVIGGMQIFTPMYIITEGGPVNSTKSIVLHLYEKAFTTYRFGYASALSTVLFVIILIFTLIQFRILRTDWEY